MYSFPLPLAINEQLLSDAPQKVIIYQHLQKYLPLKQQLLNMGRYLGETKHVTAPPSVLTFLASIPLFDLLHVLYSDVSVWKSTSERLVAYIKDYAHCAQHVLLFEL